MLEKADSTDVGKRMNLLEKAYAYQPENPNAALAYAKALTQTGRDNDALAVLAGVKQRFNNITDINLLFMEILQKMGWDGESDPSLLINKSLKKKSK